MKCCKCDICNNYVNVWREVNFDIQLDEYTNKQIKDICLDCLEVIQHEVYKLYIRLNQ
jgi:hypothetical protein